LRKQVYDRRYGVKIAFAGKGGTGKTTLSSIFIRILARRDKEVLAVDCDPDSNLGIALGFEGIEAITPIIEMEALIKERMEVSADGTFFKLNPKIDDIPEKFSVTNGNIRLIIMGAIKTGGTGCACPENAFVKNLIEHLVLKRGEDVVMDMEAGVEHFGRGTARACDSLVCVVEPSRKSLESARRISKLAKEIGIRKVLGVANKVRDEKDIDFIKAGLEGALEIIEAIPYSTEIQEADKKGSLAAISGEIINRLEKVDIYLRK